MGVGDQSSLSPSHLPNNSVVIIVELTWSADESNISNKISTLSGIEPQYPIPLLDTPNLYLIRPNPSLIPPNSYLIPPKVQTLT